MFLFSWHLSFLFVGLYQGLVTSGLASAIQIWTIGKGGPVLASIYLPLQTLLFDVIFYFRWRILLGRVGSYNPSIFCSNDNMLYAIKGKSKRCSVVGLCYSNLIIFNFEVQDYWSILNYIRLVPCCLGKKSRNQVCQRGHSPHWSQESLGRKKWQFFPHPTIDYYTELLEVRGERIYMMVNMWKSLMVTHCHNISLLQRGYQLFYY